MKHTRTPLYITKFSFQIGANQFQAQFQFSQLTPFASPFESLTALLERLIADGVSLEIQHAQIEDEYFILTTDQIERLLNQFLTSTPPYIAEIGYELETKTPDKKIESDEVYISTDDPKKMRKAIRKVEQDGMNRKSAILVQFQNQASLFATINGQWVTPLGESIYRKELYQILKNDTE